MNLYGVYIIKNYLCNKNNLLEEKHLQNLQHQLTNEILSIFIDLLNKGNKPLSYIIIWILINLSSIDFKEDLFLTPVNIIYNIAFFLGQIKEDKILTYRGIYLLRNISFNNIKIQELLLNYNIFEYCNEIYHIYFFDNNFAHNIFKCLGNFTFDINIKYEKQYLIFFDMIKPFLSCSTGNKRLNKYLNFIYNICFCDSDEIINYFFEKEIYKDLIEIYPFKEDININKDNEYYIDNIKIMVLKIFGKILSIDVEQLLIKKLIDFGLLNFFDKIIDSFLKDNNNNYTLMKYLFLCISNLSEELDYLNLLYSKGIISKLIKIGNNLYNLIKDDIDTKDLLSSFRELNYAFSLIIINSTYKNLIPTIKYKNCILIVFIIEALNIFVNKNELILLLLQALYRLIEYDKIVDEFNYKIRTDFVDDNFSEIMERNGIKSIIENYITDKRNDINIIANNIYDKLYKF